MRALLHLLRGRTPAAHIFATALDQASRRPHPTPLHAAAAAASFGLRKAVAHWPERERERGCVGRPRFFLHGQGIFDGNVLVLKLPRGQIEPMLPQGCILDPKYPDGTHPLLLFFGRHSDVRPNIWPLPGLAYDESVVAVPDVRVPDPHSAYQGPFVVLPRLWLDRLPPVLAGILMYGYAKVLARISESRDSYAVRALASGAAVSELRFGRAGEPDKPHRFPCWPAIERWLDQPILAEPSPGVEIGSVLDFRTHRIGVILPLHARVDIAADAVPGFAGGSFSATGMTAFPAAFRMRSRWEITPPLPRSWFDRTVEPARDAEPAEQAPARDVIWTRPPKRKVAVLGGGIGSLSAVWALTEQPDWQRQFDITVYQMGWRLGGKCASGRNASMSQRIEEHGLHVWAGFYENAFRIMRSCYAELARPPGTPLATIEEAFEPQRRVTLEDKIGARWASWNIDTLPNSGTPGAGAALLPRAPIDYLPALLDLLNRLLDQAPPRLRQALLHHPARSLPHLRAAAYAARTAGHDPRRLAEPGEPGGDTVLRDAAAVAQHAASAGPHRPLQLAALLDLTRRVQSDPVLDAELDGPDDNSRRIAELFDLALATLGGMIADGLVFRGFAAADREEWRDWLARHGARPATLQSPTVRSVYDYVFGFLEGDPARPALAAGTTTHGLLRLTLTYKGAFFWMMRAGMGDTVFTPLYLVLRQRGVKFAFFHKLEALRLDADRRGIDQIALRRQVAVAADYRPLVTVKGNECWPAEPRWEQIVGGDRLRHSGIDLEDEGNPIGELALLARGRDFDEVILGVSLGGLSATCGELIAASARWREMMQGLRTVATMGVQLWLRPDLAALGWRGGPTIATAYAEPLDTWADMSRLIDREEWPEQDRPGSLLYLCGALAEAGDGHADRPTAAERAKALAWQWLSVNSRHPWPAVSDPAGALDLQQLHRCGGGSDGERFDAQYFRANVAGSERYVQSVPGSTELRLRPGESGFDNLYLAGDWVRTGLDAGCVEAAAMGGLGAAAALSGRRIDIAGGEHRPFAATMLEHALDAVHGVSHLQAVVVVASLPEEIAQALLPTELAFASQPLTRSSRCPLVLMFARQLRARSNLSPIGTDYREVILLLPSVRRAPDRFGRFGYLPRMYVDNLQMLLIGRLGYRYPKDMAAIAIERGRAAVRSRIDGHPIITAEFANRGAMMPAPLSDCYDDIAWLFDRPILSRAPFGGWRTSRYDFDLDDATVQAVDVDVTIHPTLRPCMSPRPLTLRTGEDMVIGAFRLWADTSLSNPLVGMARQT